MTDKNAPERIWAWPKGSWFTSGASDRPVKAAGAMDVEYIRADLHAAAIRQARNDALREAADKCMSLKQTGGPITPGECRAAILDMIYQG